MGYNNKDEFVETVGNLEKYLNKNKRNTIKGQKYAAGTHEKTNVEYDVVGLPKFSEENIKFKCELQNNKIIANDYGQFKDCTIQLKKKINSGEISKELFTEKQLKEIQNESYRITDLTWHHDKITGKMQLVDTSIHAKTGHLGGNNIWGEGIRLKEELELFKQKSSNIN